MELIKTRSAQEIWETALGELQIQVSKPNYRTWFKKTVGLNYNDNRFVIGVPNTFAAEYLDKNQRSLIEKALIGLTSEGVCVVFQVNGKSNNGNGSGIEAMSLPVLPPSYTRLNPNYIFDYFIEGGCNRLARGASMSVAQNPGRSYNPLFIYGDSGLGKTHLLHAIGQAASVNKINVICTSAEQFTNEFVLALREKNTDEFRNKYRNIGMLLIDDIHFISGKEQTEESFFHTFNELHNTNRQIVMTSDRPPKAMPLLEERLRSRFEWGLIVDIQPPDFDTRLSILQSKAKRKSVNIDLDVLKFIARKSQTNIRVLEGHLNRVIAYARLLGETPSIDSASRALENIADREPIVDTITPELIITTVADCFCLDKSDLLGRKRDKDTSLARRLAMYLIRQETNLSLSQIGGELGNRDAAAVTNSCKKTTIDIDRSPYIKRKLYDIKRKLQPKANSNNGHK
jgi:chromosomal replication initiator protein